MAPEASSGSRRAGLGLVLGRGRGRGGGGQVSTCAVSPPHDTWLPGPCAWSTLSCPF